MKTTADLKNAILLGDSAEVLKEFPDGCLDAVVTDQIMPGMTGIDMCEKLRACAPRKAPLLKF